MPVPPCDAFLRLVDAWAGWLTYTRGRAPSTVARYRDHLQRLARWYAEPPELPRHRPAAPDPLSATLPDLELFAGELAHLRGMGPRARIPLVSALRGFYAWAQVKGHRIDNPGAGLQSPKAGLRLPRPAQLATAERLLMAPDIGTFRGLRDAAMLGVLMGCGLRLSGLCRLNESSLVWYRDDAGAERLMLRLREKGDRERHVPVPHEAALLLRAYLGSDELAAIDRTLPNGDRVLWVTTGNRTCPAHEYHGERRRIAPRTVQQLIQRYGKRLGLPADQCHPHALRHLYGAELAEEEAPILQAQALMGHADPETTQIYAHVAMRRLTATVDKANPLGKMRAPLLDSLRSIQRTVSQATPARPRSQPARERLSGRGRAGGDGG